MRVSDWSSDVCSSDFATCHQPGHWKPATFDHSRYFLLDRDHNTACTTCHLNNNYKQYTCYGCHEHQPTKIITKHREEGITNIENCVRRSEEHTSELQSLMRISYAVFCLKTHTPQPPTTLCHILSIITISHTTFTTTITYTLMPQT